MKVILGIIFLTGIALRIFHIGLHSLWCDELLAISIGKMSVSSMINYITFNDAHPPFFYLLVHFWLKFGKTSEMFLRILPLFFGILCIPFGYLFGKEFKNEKTGLFLSLFIALNPSYILWSQILKSYTLFTFLTILSSWLFLKLLKKEELSKFVLWTIFNLFLLYTHNLGFLVIFVQILSLLFLKKFNLKFLLFLLITLVLYIPWLLRIPYQLLFTLGVRRPIPLIFRFPYVLFYFFFGETLSPLNFSVLIPSFIISVLVFFFSIKNFINLEKQCRIFLLLSLIIPLLFIPFPSTVPQNLIPFSIFWFLFLILGLESRNFWNYLIFLCFFPSIFYYYKGEISQYHDPSKLIPFREIFQKIQEMERQGDIIIYTQKKKKEILSPLEWYYKGNCEIVNLNEENQIKRIHNLNFQRAFVILDFVNYPALSEKLRDFMETNYKKLEEWKFIYNEKLLHRILKKERRFYYLIEVYLFE